jgi:hypothetical protein
MRHKQSPPDIGDTVTLANLKETQHPDRHIGRRFEEAGLLERIVISTINQLRYLRVGHTPYGLSAYTGPRPDPGP